MKMKPALGPLFLLVSLLTANGDACAASSRGEKPKPRIEYAYPHEPQYQYPRTDGREMKCPAGKRPWQGTCRNWRWVRPP